MNLDLRELDFDTYVHKMTSSNFHGLDLTMIVLSKMLKVIIMMQHPDYVWLSCTNVNVTEASVVLVYDGVKTIHTTGKCHRN